RLPKTQSTPIWMTLTRKMTLTTTTKNLTTLFCASTKRSLAAKTSGSACYATASCLLMAATTCSKRQLASLSG
ncbi:hypothetical protein GGI03_007984, partial [Coemansia sp. RSA 2337]